MGKLTMVSMVTVLLQRDEADRRIPSPTYTEALERALAASAERGRVLRHYALVREHPSMPSTFTLFRLGKGRPKRCALLVGAERVEERITRELRSALAEFAREYGYVRDQIDDLRWLRSSLREQPELFWPELRDVGK